MDSDGFDPTKVTVSRAKLDDAAGIAAVHVAVWRNAYAGILPDNSLARLSVPAITAAYERHVWSGRGLLVARTASRVIGFASMSCSLPDAPAEGEVETLYVLDDWREQGIGRMLLAAAAADLQSDGCRSLFLWVLADNPSRWFYEHVGGRATLRSTTRVGGVYVPKIAMVWDPIDSLVRRL
ncbi:MAG: GNAT family N-acetyltransferase [Janthinobacterium lividum]